MTMIPVYKEVSGANITRKENERTIKQGFKNPARSAFVNIPNDAFVKLDNLEIPSQYRTLLVAIFESAAKAIISRYVNNLSGNIPSEINAEFFSAENIMEEASGNNSQWMSKEELTQAWEASATRQRMTQDKRYAENKQYRGAVNRYAELILGMSGKTTQYQESELDLILAKMEESDFDSEMGTFILRRIESIKNKPQKAAIDLDIL